MAKSQRVSNIQQYLNKIFKVFIKFGSPEPTIFALICWIIVILGSWISDFHRPPEFYFSDKRNIFNVLFAKWCLAWTLAFLTPFMVLTSWVKSRNNLKVVCKNVLRLVVAFAIWYVLTGILDCIEHWSGKCEGSDLYSRKHECLREGLIWNGYDISGHSFILSYCTLIIREEIQVVSFWTNENICSNEKILSNERVRSNERVCCNERIRPNDRIHPNEKIHPNERIHSNEIIQFVIARYVSYVLYIVCCLLMMLWMMLLVITAVYFHTAETKVVGVGMALSAWFLTYKIFFLSKYFPHVATGF